MKALNNNNDDNDDGDHLDDDKNDNAEPCRWDYKIGDYVAVGEAADSTTASLISNLHRDGITICNKSKMISI